MSVPTYEEICIKLSRLEKKVKALEDQFTGKGLEELMAKIADQVVTGVIEEMKKLDEEDAKQKSKPNRFGFII